MLVITGQLRPDSTEETVIYAGSDEAAGQKAMETATTYPSFRIFKIADSAAQRRANPRFVAPKIPNPPKPAAAAVAAASPP